jgi:hypothetical protein
MRSERINLLVTKDEKTLIDRRARKAGLSASELIRRAVIAYETNADREELQALTDELGAAAQRMESRLDATLARIERTATAIADRQALREAARADLETSGDVWPFELPDRLNGSAERRQEPA